MVTKFYSTTVQVPMSKESVQNDVETATALHREIEQLRGEKADLDWALRQQQDENRIHKQQLNNFKKEVETVEDQLAAVTRRATESEREALDLRMQVEAMSGKLTDQSLGRQGEVDGILEKIKVAERERDAAVEARDFMDVRQRQCEADAIKLQKDLNTKEEELGRAWEELAVAQATIQALQKRSSDAPSANSAAEGEAALRGRLQETTSKLQVRSRVEFSLEG